jgi:hypothetical protein
MIKLFYVSTVRNLERKLPFLSRAADTHPNGFALVWPVGFQILICVRVESWIQVPKINLKSSPFTILYNMKICRAHGHKHCRYFTRC